MSVAIPNPVPDTKFTANFEQFERDGGTYWVCEIVYVGGTHSVAVREEGLIAEEAFGNALYSAFGEW